MGRRELFRPGPVLGAYPERAVPRPDGFERFFDDVMGRVRAVLRPSARTFARRLAAIDAAGGPLESLGDAELRDAVVAVRGRLAVEGLADGACEEAFALVREQSRRTLGLRHHDVQVLGGWVILQGMVAEMQTGEGKTLTATLPAATAALAGIPVHVITVNEYLVERDAETLRPLYEALGLSVATVLEHHSPAEKRAAYACDVVYLTNKQLTFDYLRDRLARGQASGLRLRLDALFGEAAVSDQLMLRGLCFAILDEADSVLIDEARTPLIISRAGDVEEHAANYRRALELAEMLEEGRDFVVRPRERDVELTDAGRERLGELCADEAGLFASARRRQELLRQALYASLMLVRDQHYLVKDGKVQIIDEYTGRLMPDRSWERGIHQLVEAREGCEISAPNESVARISFQRFFRRYLRLGAMTGTSREVMAELWSVYRLRCVTIPTHRPSQRVARPGRVYGSEVDKWAAILDRVQEVHERGQPVLIGTASVGTSELISELLDDAGIEHAVLNARQDEDEAAMVARAGERGAVTVATNMAGRGTDISLGPGVAELGGLEVIATEKHEAGRIDRQLFGRSGRQGDPGAYGYIVSLEDSLLRDSGLGWLVRLLARLRGGDSGMLGRWLADRAQRSAERRHARIRRRLLAADQDFGKLLAFTGPME